MEIEKIVSTLQEKVGKTDFSVQTLQKACELFPVAEGQEPDDAYFTKLAGFVSSMQGQYNHDFSTKFKEVKKNLLSEDTFKSLSSSQLSEVKSILSRLVPPSEPAPAGDSTEVDTLKEEIAKLTARLDEGDKAKRQYELLQQVKSGMKSQKANDEYVLEKTLEGVVFDETKPLDALVQDYLTKYDAEYSRCRGAGTPPRQGTDGPGGEGQSWLDQQFAKKKAREGWGGAA